jgi:uncharacterized protein (DUF2141 family)
MKKLYISVTLMISLSATLFAQGKVEVTVKNIQELKGTIRMAVYSGEGNFMEKELTSKNVKVTGKEVIVVFENVKPGEYAISTYHDVDDNKELNTGFMGIPKEPYGFSNDARGTFGPPTYEKAKFKVAGDTKTSIKVE